MGCFTSGIAFNELVDVSALKKIFSGYENKVYKINELGLYLLDSYILNDEEYPFTGTRPDTEDDVFPLPSSLVEFRKVCRKSDISIPYFPRSSLGAPYLISKNCNCIVGDFSSDDDETNQYIQFNNGNFEYIRFLADDLEIIFSNDAFEIYPLILEIEEDQTPDDALNQISSLPNITVHNREKEYNLQIHALVENELSKLCGNTIDILGTFDDIEWEKFEVVYDSATNSKPWWKFW